MKSTVKKLPNSQVELSFTLDPKQLEEQREIAFNKLAEQVKVPGFRPGRAPRRMIEERMNPTAAMQQALDVVLNQEYQEAIKEHELVPVAQPEVDIESMDITKPITVKATVQVRPEAKVGDYSKIKAKKEAPSVSDEKLDETMKTIFERSTQNKPGEREKGEGEHEAGGLVGSDGQPLKTDQPEAQMDDEWAKTLGARSLEDLRAQVKQDLEGQSEYETQTKWQEEVFDALINMTKTEVPEAFIEDELSRMRANYQTQLQSLGITLDDYLKQAGKSQSEMEEQWRPQAEKQATLEIALAEVAKRENIDVDEAEVEAELAKVDEKTRAQFQSPQQRYYLTYSLWRQKVMKHILDTVEKNQK
jgi:trigger factor